MAAKLTKDQVLAVQKHIKNRIGEVTYAVMTEEFNKEDRGFEVSVYQVVRIAREWKETGGYEDWLFERWFYLHKQVEDTNVELAYKRVSTLMEKLITRKYSHRIDGKVELEASDKIMELVRELYAEKRREPPESSS